MKREPGASERITRRPIGRRWAPLPGIALAVLVLSGVACSEPEPPTAEEIAEARLAAIGGRGGTTAAPATAPAAPAPRPSWETRRSTPTARPASPRAESPAGAGEAAATAEPALPELQERNLGDELRAAIGSPASCLDFEAARRAGDRLVVRVSAYVSVTGIITRAEAASSSLEPSALRCVEARVQSVRLQGPIEGAPMRISTVLEFDVSVTAPVSADDTPRARALPPGAAPPGTTLPAVGAEGRPEGSVAPSLTLPAVVP